MMISFGVQFGLELFQFSRNKNHIFSVPFTEVFALEDGALPLTLVEGMGLRDFVWHFTLTLPATSHSSSLFSTTAQATGEDFSGNGCWDLDATGVLSTPVPAADKPITGVAELKDAVREGFWLTKAWLPKAFFSRQEEERGPVSPHFQHVLYSQSQWPATSAPLLPDSWG